MRKGKVDIYVEKKRVRNLGAGRLMWDDGGQEL